MRLTKVPKPPTSLNELYEIGGTDPVLLVKVYRGPHAQHRRDTEDEMLRLWREHGYGVPAVSDMAVPSLTGPYLVMSRLPGRSLRHILEDESYSRERQLAELRRVLADLASRHARALETDNLSLVHRDCSTTNVLLTDEHVMTLDLETRPDQPTTLDACAAELAKLLRWSMQDLGRDSIPSIGDLAWEIYAAQPGVIDRLLRQTLQRPWQWVHRWRDARRRRKDARRVTKYDVAGALTACRPQT